MARISFIWGYRKTIAAWLAKDDAMSEAICTLGKVYSVHIFVLANKTTKKIVSSVTWHFFASEKEMQSAISTAPSALIILNGPLDFDKVLLPKLREKAILGYYSHGDFGVNSLYLACSLIFVAHLSQCYELETKFTKSFIVVAPHTPNLEKFYEQSSLEKKFDAVYPTRQHEVKRIYLFEEAARMASIRYCITDSIPAKKMVELYNSTRCVGFTSRNEGGPRVVLEAQATNTPVVVCSDCRTCVEYVKKFGGFIASPNVRDIAEKLRIACNSRINSRARLREAGYDSTYMYEQMLKGIQEILR